ncbi:tyrosine-type recombinase/integrase [Brevundimonas subvibrioides]|uniref:Integrase family protein n=1 Tax=Brevundimonas subvibrioides (strain ATCC 15264 / DSM 4735 / LMG 14903 / NBRC 16000 / CB 81) TaxID=633149 RepID=D9QFU9_BRESC|nr:tyrosine-type recombinase/integrase [Brevundimonas subvibrioides]ADL00663.1 integrase family protein [Brevundimonas subvibrioides ATCC 15264]
MAQDGVKDDPETVRVPFVQRVRKPNGDVHLYFRRGAFREGPLKSPDGSPELKAEIDAILERVRKASDAIARPAAGTVGGMLKAYNKSAEFLSLARITQRGYQDYIDELIADTGDLLLSEVTRSWVIGMRDAWALRGHNAANKRMQVLKNALMPAIEDDTDQRIQGDPFHKVRKVRRPHDAGEAHPAWELAEVEIAIEEAIRRDQPGLARAIALGRYGGFRRGTIVSIPLNARTLGRDGRGEPETRLVWITSKRQVLSDKREDARLAAVIARTPNRALTIAYNKRGDPFSVRQFDQALERLLDRLAADGKIRATIKRTSDGRDVVVCPLTIHGLRHARGVELAEAGASDAEIMAQLEHASDAAAKIYRRQAQRRKMADAGQDRIDNVVKLKARQAARKARNGA